MLSIIILATVFILIAVRRIGKIKLQIWQIMLFGAIAMLLTKQISPINALKAIDVDVMIFLFGMFVVGSALEKSGYLADFSNKFFGRIKSADQLLLLILFTMGFLSAILMNDTIAIIATPLMLILSKKYNIEPKLLLLTLAFAVTIGSTASPIGNPQNLLIAEKIPDPFLTFLKYLFIPSIINIFIAYIILKIFWRKKLEINLLAIEEKFEIDSTLSKICKISILIILIMIILKILLIFAGIEIKLIYIAIFACLPILIFSKKRVEIIKKVDWHTLIFFASMFIVTKSAWESGFFQKMMGSTSIEAIFLVSVIFSQFISNVPLVALYLPMLSGSIKEMMALAGGATLAGNFSILGAASNVIIIQNAEKRGATISFVEFAKIGIPLTILNVLVCWLFISAI
ncbi:MAG: SLC13 family permease [Candidatus Thermoplasmatota archaeon]